VEAVAKNIVLGNEIQPLAGLRGEQQAAEKNFGAILDPGTVESAIGGAEFH